MAIVAVNTTSDRNDFFVFAP
jgi:hypothetical protein